MFSALLRGGPLSPAMLQRIREVLRAALNGAIRRGLIATNPARWGELPSSCRPRAVVWTAPGSPSGAPPASDRPSRCGLSGGPRPSSSRCGSIRCSVVLAGRAARAAAREVVDLRWCDIDLDERGVDRLAPDPRTRWPRRVGAAQERPQPAHHRARLGQQHDAALPPGAGHVTIRLPVRLPCCGHVTAAGGPVAHRPTWCGCFALVSQWTRHASGCTRCWEPRSLPSTLHDRSSESACDATAGAPEEPPAR
jgi:hypothetical protein